MIWSRLDWIEDAMPGIQRDTIESEMMNERSFSMLQINCNADPKKSVMKILSARTVIILGLSVLLSNANIFNSSKQFQIINN
ncbi:hypothetical protein FGO68_gene5059 [Halteria grandinella]|uniref:Uncharacterized protein n=1 Tax=Halteria grandinella TaxID=5974 RepID=A0A8J8P3V7_HALGN|nr:hypothetical protein FGO68_gene5059 [Halteria grandinella]